LLQRICFHIGWIERRPHIVFSQIALVHAHNRFNPFPPAE
jgi:hypothetical protein